MVKLTFLSPSFLSCNTSSVKLTRWPFWSNANEPVNPFMLNWIEMGRMNETCQSISGMGACQPVQFWFNSGRGTWHQATFYLLPTNNSWRIMWQAACHVTWIRHWSKGKGRHKAFQHGHLGIAKQWRLNGRMSKSTECRQNSPDSGNSESDYNLFLFRLFGCQLHAAWLACCVLCTLARPRME